MRSDTDHREQLDDFSEFMKRKLEDHRLPVDDLCWEEIEPRMKSRQRNLLWWVGSSVAAAIAVMLLLLPFRMEEKLSEKINEQMASALTEEEIVPDSIEVFPDEVVIPVDKTVHTKKLIAAVSVKQPVVNMDEQPDGIVTDLQPGMEQEIDNIEETPAAEPEKEEKKESKKQIDLNNYDSKNIALFRRIRGRRRKGTGR